MTSRNLTPLPLLLQRPWYCRHKILDPFPPKTGTSFVDDPLCVFNRRDSRCFDYNEIVSDMIEMLMNPLM